MDYEKKILVTGGAGFIGSHVIRHFLKKYPNYLIVNLDKLTYAGNLENLADVEDLPNYRFVKGDICDWEVLVNCFEENQIDGIIHLAAESHVDRSISNPMDFIQSNIVGTANLLNAAKHFWENDFQGKTFYHVSTDEVYGSLTMEGHFTEDTSYDPRSPYSASKASSDHLVRAYFHTYGLPIKLSNCSNNYGSHQFPEKLIPLIINNIRQKKPLPVYGKGENIRDWLWVVDHAQAIDVIFHKGENGETYNVGGNSEWRNIDLVELLCDVMDQKLSRAKGSARKTIQFVSDRPGHDLRYAIDASKLAKRLGWAPSISFQDGLANTVEWYLQNEKWLESITSGSYQDYYSRMNGNR